MMEQSEITLVCLGPEHLETTFQWLLNPLLRRSIDSPKTPSWEGHVACWRSRWQDQTRKDYAILVSEKRHVGNCGLIHIDHDQGKAELWIYVPEGKRKGIGSGAVNRLLSDAFHSLKLNHVFVRVLADNVPALSFFRSIGFEAVDGNASTASVWLFFPADRFSL